MKTRMHGSRWLHRSHGLLLGLALVSGLLLSPSSALADTEQDYFKAMKDVWNGACTVGGWISKGITAYNVASMIGQWVGILNKAPDNGAVIREVDRIAKYQDWQFKETLLNDIEQDIQNCAGPMFDNATAIASHTFDVVGRNTELWDQGSRDAVIAALGYTLGGACPYNSALFQILSPDPTNVMDYDWRIGMMEALKAVAVRLAFIPLKYPDYQTNPAFVGPDGELTSIMSCLQQHRDLIHPPKPFRYCTLTSGCSQGGCGCQDYVCSESRSWVQWPVTTSHPKFPLCADYVYGTADNGWVPSYASRVAYEDAEADAESGIDHDNQPVVFALQRMIDILKIVTSGQSDLAATNQLIRLGSDPSLCLAAIWNTNPTTYWSLGLDSCSSANPLHNWTYDRATGRISTRMVPNRAATSHKSP